MDNDLFPLAKKYGDNNQIGIVREPVLGHGTDGSVWRTVRKTAVKAFFYEKNYLDELECYQRFKTEKITAIEGLAVPILEGFDDEMMVIEMTIVQTPYLLDFGKVYIDCFPPYWHDKQLMANWHSEVRDLFGGDASRVYTVLSRLKSLGIHYVDPKPANISFAEIGATDDA